MKYAATYDIGERKRKNNGINEDSIAITLLQDGHRNGLEVVDKSSKNQQKKNLNVRGPGDEPDKNVDGPNESATTEVYPKGGPTEDTSSQHHNSKPQDRYAGIFVLADGAGGEDAGDIASYLASTVITEKLSGPVHQARRLNTGGFGIEVPEDAFGDKLSDEEIESEIDGAILAAHREIIRYANKTQSGGTYSTVVVGVYLDNKFHYGWVGDSRAYVVNESHEEISLLTKDHAKVQQWEDSGEIDKVEGHVHPDGNEITRAIGGRSGTDPKKAQITVDTGTGLAI
jgi:Serine/threonine protein phosphatase